jgi:hypothetical protein
MIRGSSSLKTSSTGAAAARSMGIRPWVDGLALAIAALIAASSR